MAPWTFHKDNHNPLAAVHNLLVHVRGRKRVCLVSADQDDRMYPDASAPTTARYSQVDSPPSTSGASRGSRGPPWPRP